MNPEPPLATCETCGRPYVVDESADAHMNPPDDYRRGYQRYCLTCWLGVGPKDCPETGYTEFEERVEPPVSPSPGSEIQAVRTLRPTFEKGFKPVEPEIWSNFLERFGKSEGRICYYPSAGSDFRPVIYQQFSGMAVLGLVDKNGGIPRPGAELFEHSNYAAPDLWILSDFRGDHLTEWLETKLVHSDKKVKIRLLTHTEIHPQRIDFQQRPSPAYTSLPPTVMTGRVFYIRLSITNETIGTVEVDVIYFCIENVNLIRSFLLRQHIPLSHLVWVREGAGFGGGRLRHNFLIPLLTLFETRWLFLEDRYHQNLGEARWPKELLFHKRMLAGQVPDLHAIGSFQSGADRIVFCQVDSARAKEAMEKEQKQMIEHRIQEERNKSKPSVYLWFCCEGWMKFGPFEWLRFDDQSQAILGPNGEVVAKKIDGYWQMPSGRGEGMQFSDPTITTSPIHPHKGSSSHPAKVQ